MNVHYRVYKSPQLFPQQSSLFPTDFFNIDFNIILPSTPRSSKWSLSFMFPYGNSVWISPITHTCHRPHPSLYPWFDHLHNLWCGEQIMKILNFSTFLLLPTSEVRISSSAPYSRTQSAQVLPLMRATKFQTIHKTTGKIVFLHILILLFRDSKSEDQRFRTA